MDEIKIIDYPESYNPQESYGFDGYSDFSDYSQLNKSYEDYYKFILENTKYNNAWSAEQAQKQMDFQAWQAELERMYGSQEAAKNRDWQEYMSSTAHQREMADLKAAGLNPVLSAMNGNGASVTSGATASRTGAPSGAKGDADQSANMALVSMLNGFISAQTQLETARVSAEASMAVADKYNAMSKILEEMKEAYSTFEHENYPSSLVGALSALIGGFAGDNPSNAFQTFLDKYFRYGEGEDTKAFSTKNILGNLDAILSGDIFTADYWKKQNEDFKSKVYKPGTGSKWHTGTDFSGSHGKY